MSSWPVELDQLASFFGEVGGRIAWEDSPERGAGRDLGVEGRD